MRKERVGNWTGPLPIRETTLLELDGCPRFAKAYLGRKRRGDPDFLYAALDTTAYAAFIKESRMKCAGATKLHRKSGGSPTNAFCSTLSASQPRLQSPSTPLEKGAASPQPYSLPSA